jgi:hypothetical protein
VDTGERRSAGALRGADSAKRLPRAATVRRTGDSLERLQSNAPGDEFAGEPQINRLQKIRYLAAAEARRQAVRGQLDEIPLFQGAGADHDVVDLMIRQNLPRRPRCCRHQAQHREITTVVPVIGRREDGVVCGRKDGGTEVGRRHQPAARQFGKGRKAGNGTA